MYRHARAFNRPGQLIKAMAFGLVAFVSSLAVPVLLVSMLLLDPGDAKRSVGVALLVAMALAVLSRVLLYTVGHRTRCPLCTGNLFHNKGCHPHERAVKYPGFSHAGSMVVDLFFRRSFRCMYCGTAFRIFK